MTFILYIAIILVLLGFVFIYTSVEVRKAPFRTEAASAGKDEDLPDIDLGSSASFPDLSLVAQSVLTEPGKPAETEFLPDQAVFPVVLYVDEKGGVTLEGGALSDASGYGSFARVGAGTGEVLSDALTVRIDKKLFRYDFFRVREITAKGDCAALFLQGDSRSNIFIAENDLFAKVLSDRFTSYMNKG
ncbi:MAG: hypothetical protein ACRCUT_03795 [Spirochaetota bacterium]